MFLTTPPFFLFLIFFFFLFLYSFKYFRPSLVPIVIRALSRNRHSGSTLNPRTTLALDLVFGLTTLPLIFYEQ
jgi:hypothetical protein